jgi:hypothetical protein
MHDARFSSNLPFSIEFVNLGIQEIRICSVRLPNVIRQAVEKKKRRQQQVKEQKAELERFNV